MLLLVQRGLQNGVATWLAPRAIPPVTDFKHMTDRDILAMYVWHRRQREVCKKFSGLTGGLAARYLAHKQEAERYAGELCRRGLALPV